MNVDIISTYRPEDLVSFEALTVNEWPEIELPLDSAMAPILAKNEEAIVGGLSFVRYAHPSRMELSLWINSLLVIPAWRRKGVGSALVKSAMHVVPPDTELFVFTDVPDLYLGLAWTLIPSEMEGKVLRHGGNGA